MSEEITRPDFHILIYALERLIRDIKIDDDMKNRARKELKQLRVAAAGL